MAKLHLTIVTPEKQVFEGEADQINISTSTGQIGVLPEHASLMTNIAPGELEIIEGGKNKIMAVGRGLLQVANNKASLIIDLAETPEEINEKVAEEARKRAEEALSQKLTHEEYAVAMANLQKALAQLKVKKRHLHQH